MSVARGTRTVKRTQRGSRGDFLTHRLATVAIPTYDTRKALSVGGLFFIRHESMGSIPSRIFFPILHRARTPAGGHRPRTQISCYCVALEKVFLSRGPTYTDKLRNIMARSEHQASLSTAIFSDGHSFGMPAAPQSLPRESGGHRQLST